MSSTRPSFRGNRNGLILPLNQGVMRRQWSLCLLYLLQVIVLWGMLAGHILNTPERSTHNKQQESLFEQTSPGQGRSKISKVKPSVKMKPIALFHLKESLLRVSSPLELARLLTDANDHQSNHGMSRKVRSVSHSSGHHFQEPGQHKPLTKQEQSDSVISDSDKDNIWKMDNHEENSNKNIFDEDEPNSVEESDDIDYVYDFPQDEASQDDLEAFESALHHIEDMKTCSASKCKHPMPFVQSVQDPYDLGRVYLPECVLLHRCMNYTGCCGGGNHECVPKSMSIITKAFLIVDRHSTHGDHVTFNPSMATTITFVNHTECECREKPAPLKCTKACPQPFRLTQDGIACRCDCFLDALRDSWPCESVKDGIVPLSHDGQECIKNNSCYRPECTVGYFDIQIGLCPLSDEYALPAFIFENQDERRTYREHLSSYDFTDSHSKHRVSENDITKHYTSSDHNGSHRDRTDTKEQALSSQDISLLESDKPTVQMSFKDSKFPYLVSTKSSLSVYDSRNIHKHSTTFSLDDIKFPRDFNKKHSVKSTPHTSSDKPVYELEDLGDVSANNVPDTNMEDNNDNRKDMREELFPNNITREQNISKYVEHFNETSGINNVSAHKKSVKKMSEETNDVENTNSDSESPHFVQKSDASESSLYTNGQTGSSSNNSINKEHAKPHEDHSARESWRSILRHKFHVSSHYFHEDFRSVGVSSKSQNFHGSEKNSLKKLPQSTTESLSSLSSFQILPSSSSTTTAPLLPSQLPHPVNHRQYAPKQTVSRDHEHSKTSNGHKHSKTSHDKFQLEGLLNYNHNNLDGSGEDYY